jgi:pyruvate formate lyase activating enzyme
VEAIQVLPYHRAGAEKYSHLGREYTLAETKEPSGENVATYLAKKTGLAVQIGG